MATIIEIASMSEAEARAYLERVRWAGEPSCPHCGSTRCGGLKGVKDKKGDVREGLYKCYSCRRQFTVTTGTVMHRSHLSMQQWAVAFYMVCSGKKGVAALEIQRVLGIGSYKCAWHMIHRIREAMAESPDPLLGGIVEADETYIGGKSRKMMPGRGSERKTAVLAVAERGGSIVSHSIQRVNAKTLHPAVRAVASPYSKLCTDEWAGYSGIGKHFGGGHHTVAHVSSEYARGDVHCNSCESFFGLLKRGVHGVFYHISRKHIDRYCHEFAFRWNRRKTSDGARAESLIAQTGGRRLEYRDLVG